MALSWVDIANMAGGRIGISSRVTNLETGTDKASVTFNAVLPNTAEAILRKWDWKCVSQRAQLTKDATAPIFGPKNRYLLPPDCLIVREFRPHRMNYVVEGQYLLTDVDSDIDQVFIRYTAFPKDPSVLDALCAKAIAWRIAAETCNVFVQGNSQTGQSAILREYQLVIEEAEGANQWIDKNHDSDTPHSLEGLRHGHDHELDGDFCDSWISAGQGSVTW